MADQDRPTRASNMEKAEGDREEDREEAPREDAPETRYEQGKGAGITNRPLGEEIEKQKEVPARGESKPGAHAG
ncbi:MAG TPA: hypothetical protein VEL51_13590 [Vicinamibacterales bacterium]|nr:hypothetical protein [Vicinamibacterales bacterium]